MDTYPCGPPGHGCSYPELFDLVDPDAAGGTALLCAALAMDSGDGAAAADVVESRHSLRNGHTPRVLRPYFQVVYVDLSNYGPPTVVLHVNDKILPQ